MSKHYLCHHHADGITIDAERDNMKLNGFFECEKSRCVKIKKPFSCDRYCAKITTAAVNVLIMRDDSLITAECDIGFASNEARGADEGIRIDPPKKIWVEKDGILLTNCFDVTRDGDKLRYGDKTNIFSSNVYQQARINFNTYWILFDTHTTHMRLQSNGLRKWHTVEGERITGTIYELYTILEDL